MYKSVEVNSPHRNPKQTRPWEDARTPTSGSGKQGTESRFHLSKLMSYAENLRLLVDTINHGCLRGETSACSFLNLGAVRMSLHFLQTALIRSRLCKGRNARVCSSKCSGRLPHTDTSIRDEDHPLSEWTFDFIVTCRGEQIREDFEFKTDN